MTSSTHLNTNKDVGDSLETNPEGIEVPNQIQQKPNLKTKLIHVTLKEIKMDHESFCHRDETELSSKSIKDLKQSIAAEGLQTPIEVFRKNGELYLISGHRRVTALNLLAESDNEAFSDDMNVPAVEVYGDATKQELMLRSVMANEFRKDLNQIDRIKLAKKFEDNQIPRERVAKALGISEKTLERDLLIAQHPWMLGHIKNDCISTTNAFLLLNAAKNADRLKDLEEYLGVWIHEQETELANKNRDLKNTIGKELTPPQCLVKNQMNKTKVDHWIDCLQKKEELTELEVSRTITVDVDLKNGKLRVDQLRINLQQIDLTDLIKIGGKFNMLVKQLAPIIKKRHEWETLSNNNTKSDSKPYDLNFLREIGLDDVVEEIENGKEEGEDSDHN